MRRPFISISLLLAGLAACADLTDPIDGGTPVELTWSECAGSLGPTWFAVQDGDGAWTRVAPTGGSFNFTISQGRGGIATYSPEDGLSIAYLTTQEMEEELPSCTGSVRTVSGSVTGYATIDAVNVFMGPNVADFTTLFGGVPAPQSFSLPEIAPTTVDVAAVRYQTTAGATTYEDYPIRIALLRDISGTSAGTIDVSSSASSSLPIRRDVAITNLSLGETLEAKTTLWMKTTAATVSFFQDGSANVSGEIVAPFWGLRQTSLQTGETQQLQLTAEKQVGSTTDRRVLSVLYEDITDRTLTFGPTLGGVTFSGGGRPSASYTIQAGYDNLFRFIVKQAATLTQDQKAIKVLVTRAYMDDALTVTVAVPNLTGVAGFQPAWGLTAGQQATWEFRATNDQLSVLADRPAAFTEAVRSSTFVP